ncbi:asparagine synthase-related protein [Candidatus Nitrosotenuis chungbukensis]|uniref:asparagine synthase-related protein n=1 Tax=Candidatus Nitrosotenuis chungbukensis TaxID=1353246 RepID=UPI000B22E27A|nr:asparagine synthase-related protein [Candidatus Nitrosotenuis chungbukensis]WKT57598.1 asparagine synthase-related protein [Candidatus Nitrosotenuis chungbukensis]
MSQVISQTYQIIEKAVLQSSTDCLSLSGGLDSTILAYFLRDRKIGTVSIIAKDFLANDLTYCQLAASKFNLPLNIRFCGTDEIYSGIEETIKILKNFNDIEIRNNVVMYLALSVAKELGFSKVMTGDGADEIFAGYNFLLNKSADELESDLKRIGRIMHFPSQKIGKALGIDVVSPFCNKEVVEFAKTIPADLKVHEEGGKKFGKWILRKAFEGKIPNAITWRQKSPMQDGAGTQSLTEFFNSAIPDPIFNEKAKKIKDKDGVIIRTKESLQYYEIYRRYNEPKTGDSGITCPDCRHSIEEDSKFCRMCGRFPL